MKNVYGFTVVTPTYNRAHSLPRVYRTLLAQSFGDFEWLIIDDGSTDNTNQLVSDWISEKRIPIRYVWQENQHKKTAFNRGVEEAQGLLIVVLDSDDELLPDALASMWELWHEIPDAVRDSYIAVTGLCVNQDHQVVGDRFPADVQDMPSIDMFFKHHPKGEKFGCLNTAILRQYPFPEQVEGFVPESMVWRKIARKGHKTRFVNEPFRIYHQSEDSLSKGGAENPATFALGYLLLARDTLVNCLPWFFHSPSEFIKAGTRYTRFRLHLDGHKSTLPELARLKGIIPRCLVALTYPLGYYLYRKDIKRLEELSDHHESASTKGV